MSAAHQAPSTMSHQDWDPVVIKKAVCEGGKCPVGGPKRSGEGARMAKLEAAETPSAIRHKVFTAESVAAIQAYRRVNNLTQKQLDQQLSFPAGTVGSLEARRGTPAAAILGALNRLLKTGLTLE
jgi:hypothetical protein